MCMWALYIYVCSSGSMARLYVSWEWTRVTMRLVDVRAFIDTVLGSTILTPNLGVYLEGPTRSL